MTKVDHELSNESPQTSHQSTRIQGFHFCTKIFVKTSKVATNILFDQISCCRAFEPSTLVRMVLTFYYGWASGKPLVAFLTRPPKSYGFCRNGCILWWKNSCISGSYIIGNPTHELTALARAILPHPIWKDTAPTPRRETATCRLASVVWAAIEESLTTIILRLPIVIHLSIRPTKNLYENSFISRESVNPFCNYDLVIN